jgi:hypothetical protein
LDDGWYREGWFPDEVGRERRLGQRSGMSPLWSLVAVVLPLLSLARIWSVSLVQATAGNAGSCPHRTDRSAPPGRHAGDVAAVQGLAFEDGEAHLD